MPRTSNKMVVNHADCLHERVADGRADEFKSSPEQVAAHRVGLGSARGHFGHSPPAILDWLPADEAPEVSVETSKLLTHRQKRLCVLNRGCDLQPVSYDSGVSE